MKLKSLLSLCMLLCVCILLLCSCFLVPMGPDLDFQKKKEQGLYPTTADFPNTKWVCREIDLYFYMFDYGENTMIGEYIHNGVSYRVIAGFNFSVLDFDIISSTHVSESEYKIANSQTSLIYCEPEYCGNINTEYIYKNETIICSVRNYYPVESESIPSILTFDNVGIISQLPDTRWLCDELNMYIDSFCDTEGYYKGNITIDNKNLFIHAYEIGNSGYFEFAIQNGILNNFPKDTTSYLVSMYFEFYEDKIVAKITDDVLDNLQNNYWPYQGDTLTFYKVL